jgi:aryl sulfotransferase
MPFHDDTLYIHVARDPRDACMSYHNHENGLSDHALGLMDAQGLAITEIAAPYPRPLADPHDFFRRWLRDPAFAPFDDWTCAEYFDLQRSYWAVRGQPNVLMIHYNDLKADLEGEMRRIAAFIGVKTPPSLWPDLVDAASFTSMQRDGDAILGMAAQSWKEGSKTFLHKGTNDRWRGLLTDADLADYDAAASAGMTPSGTERFGHWPISRLSRKPRKVAKKIWRAIALPACPSGNSGKIPCQSTATRSDQRLT